ncbi:MAG: T9SS type A sorting domain-containing protein [Bacteroidales bacterium]|nr:T9SS type A sorting domain-containing protein [Bacteroidales bacterium]
MKLVRFILAVCFIAGSIALKAGDDERCFNSMGSHCYTKLEGEELIVLFDTVFSAFQYELLFSEIEDYGLISYLPVDTTRKTQVFRPLYIYSDSAMIDLIYNLDFVDTIYWPLVNEDNGVVYYDIEKICVWFDESLSEENIEEIVDTSGCSIFEEGFNNRYVLVLEPGNELFQSLNRFSKYTEVEMVDLEFIGYGGRVNEDCDHIIDLNDYESNLFNVEYEGSNLYLLINVNYTSSPCIKVSDLVIQEGNIVNYYGVYTSGDAASPCQLTDTVVIEVIDPYDISFIANFIDQQSRCIYRKELQFSEVTLNTLNEAEQDEVNYSLIHNEFSVYLSEEGNQIREITAYNILGSPVLTKTINDNTRFITTDLSGLNAGIYIINILFEDLSSESIKILKY